MKKLIFFLFLFDFSTVYSLDLKFEKIVDDQVRAFTVAVRLIAELLEKKNGK